MRVSIDNSGTYSFIRLCKKKIISVEDIDNLLQSDAYNRAINLMGENWGIGGYNNWKEYFEYALLDSNNINEESLSSEQIRFANHIIEAKENIDKISVLNNKIENIIRRKEFVNIASKYAFTDKINKIDVNMLIFGPNAGGYKEIIVDLPFFAEFNEYEISRVLAHELHHIIRDEYEVIYCIDEKYWAIKQAIFWFESEGIANLCNFNETSKLYEKFGYAKPGAIEENLEYISQHIESISNLIVDIYEGNKESSELYNYLIHNVKFHSVAYFMAKTIKELSGEEVIKMIVGDSLKFINQYQSVCKCNSRLNNYAFSKSAIKVLNKLFIKQ